MRLVFRVIDRLGDLGVFVVRNRRGLGGGRGYSGVGEGWLNRVKV